MGSALREKVEECVKAGQQYSVFLVESGDFIVVCVDPKSGSLKISEVKEESETKYFY